MPTSKEPSDDESLKRLGGGRWQTRDERFTIEPQSGTWAVVDAEQTDDLGLPLVRGPFPSLTAAKAAIVAARTSEPATSPLARRVAAGGPARGLPERAAERPATPRSKATTETRRPGSATEAEPAAHRKASPPRRAADEPKAEPGWFAEISASERGRARRLIRILADAGIPDAEGIVRRDLAGGVPAVAAVAVARALGALGDDPSPDAVARALVDGRDPDLDVRWRLVDGDGRPIVLDGRGSRRRR